MSTQSNRSEIPPVVVETARSLLGQLAELRSTLVDEICTSQPIYADFQLVPRDDLERSCEDHLSYVLGELSGLRRDTRVAAAVGRRRAEQGVPLQAMLHAYRLGARYIATLLLETSAGLFRREYVQSTVETAWAMFEEYTEAVSSTYIEAVAEKTRRHAESRSAMAGALLAGQLADGPQLVEAALTLQLPLHGTFVVATVQGEQPGDTAVDVRLGSARMPSAWHRGIDTHTGVIQAPSMAKLANVFEHLTPSGTERVGVSAPFTGLEQASTAARQARLAVSCAEPGGVVRYDEAPLQILLANSPEAAAHLAASVLGPVLALPDRERDVLLDTMRAWFETGGSAAQTASAMFVHRNTVGYRIQQLASLTGRLLTNSKEAAQLYVALEAHELLSRGLAPSPTG